MEMDEVFKNLPLAEQKKMLDHLVKLPDVRFLSSEEQEKYDESIKAADDYYSGLYGSYVEGEEKGIAKGMAKGIAKGRAEGMAKVKIDIAYRLLSMGLSEAQVSTATELPLEEIQKMRK
jgi:predicted transposase/invertase (TIGR01784 family)